MTRSQRPVWLGEDQRKWDHIRVHIQLLDDPRLGPYELAVYLGIARHAEIASGHAHPSVPTLARYGSMGIRRVDQALSVLTECGYVEVQKQRGKASVYVLLAPPPPHVVRGSDDGTPAPDAEDPRTTCGTTPAPRADELDPVDESQENDAAVAGPSKADVLHAEAKAIVDKWWDERKAEGNPVGQRWIACLGVVKGMLRQEVPASRIEWALRNAPVCSTGALEMSIQQELQRRGEREVQPKVTARMQRLMNRPDGLRKLAEAAGYNVDDPSDPLALPPGATP